MARTSGTDSAHETTWSSSGCNSERFLGTQPQTARCGADPLAHPSVRQGQPEQIGSRRHPTQLPHCTQVCADGRFFSTGCSDTARCHPPPGSVSCSVKRPFVSLAIPTTSFAKPSTGRTCWRTPSASPTVHTRVKQSRCRQSHKHLPSLGTPDEQLNRDRSGIRTSIVASPARLGRCRTTRTASSGSPSTAEVHP
jgi:hypothetical protein